MTIYFSESTRAFYPADLLNEYNAAGSLPNDLIEITEEETDLYFCKSAPDGKMLGIVSNRPQWIDLPEKTEEELAESALVQISKLLSLASVKIAPLQDAVDLGIATTDETTALAAWKNYRVLVNRVITQSGYPTDIDWPSMPE